MRCAVDMTIGTAGSTGNYAAVVLDADIPALSRKGASEALGGRLVFSRDTLASDFRGVEIPLKANDMGHYMLTVEDFDGPRGCGGRGPEFSASMVEWACSRKRS